MMDNSHKILLVLVYQYLVCQPVMTMRDILFPTKDSCRAGQSVPVVTLLLVSALLSWSAAHQGFAVALVTNL